MKLHKLLLASLAVLPLAFGSCSPDSVDNLDPNGRPKSSDINARIEVDQETNQITFTLDNPGCYPVWRVYKTADKYALSTVNGYKDIIALAGTYQVEVQMGNHNGVCEGSKTYEFTLDNTIVDWTPYMTRLTAGSSKIWQIDNDVPGHLGCGEPGTDGLNWWSAAKDDKAAWGVYDNRMIFGVNGGSNSGAYTFDPGTSGTIYVNTGITEAPFGQYNTNDGIDYVAPVEPINTTFEFSMEGTDLFITFPQGALVGYLPNMDAYNNPRFRVLALDNSQLQMVHDNGGIAWHYTFCPEKHDDSFKGFVYDSEFNLWKAATKGTPGFWYAPGWNQIADPELTITESSYTFTLPEATTDQWQGQFFIPTDMSSDSGHNYDFSVVISVSQDHPGITFKLTEDGDDGNFFFADRVPVKAGEDYVFWMSDMAGIDAPALKMFFDFGGNAAGTEVTIKNIVFKDHANDDGTVLPTTPTVSVDWVDWDSPENLWHAANIEAATFWFADDGWSQIADPSWDITDRGYKIAFDAVGGSQWQGQVHLVTDIATTSEQNYDFRITFSSTANLPAVTVKLTDTTDDNNFLTADRHEVAAYDDVTVEIPDMQGIDAGAIKLVLDFGGSQAPAEVDIKDIILQVHK